MFPALSVLLASKLDKAYSDFPIERMPLVNIYSSHRIKKQIIESLSDTLTTLVASNLGKSEDFVMILFQRPEFQSFGNNAMDHSVYIELKNVGTLSPDTTQRLTSAMTECLVEAIDLAKSRIYIEFQESDRHLWAWGGKTFSK